MTPKCWTENPTFWGHIMSKISNEIRLEAVQRVVEDGMSMRKCSVFGWRMNIQKNCKP